MNTINPLLIEVGFCAVRSGSFDAAQKIFLAIAKYQPEDAAGCIGLASILLAKGEIDIAVSTLEVGLEHAVLNQYEAKKLLLIAYMLQGDKFKAEQLHRQFIMKSHCPMDENNSTESLQRASNFFN